jgi:uncharacterized protein YndB with AHSA1/START domain
MTRWSVVFAGLLAGAAVAEERAIDQRVTVKAPVSEVWKAWTTSEGIKSFFAPDARVELRVGGPFQIYFDPGAKSGLKGADDMVILAFQHERMLSFTWNAPPDLPEARKHRTVVIVRFRPAGDGGQLTEVLLHHTGWGDGGEWDQAFDYFSMAWPRVLGGLTKRFTDGPTDWRAFLEQLKAARKRPVRP